MQNAISPKAEAAHAGGAPTFDAMRQAQILVGTFILAGVTLGVLVSPWFLIVPGFMGCGLIFAGVSGSCGMASLMAKMPWNRTVGGAACGIDSAGASSR